MSASTSPEAAEPAESTPRPLGSAHAPPEREVVRWGGYAALAGVVSMIGAFAVVIALGLPDASDPETLVDFADIESGRIAEHFLYLGALVLFALHIVVLHRLLAGVHAAAALFGTVLAAFGLVILAASSVLHLSTSPLSDLYRDPSTPAADRAAVEYAWHGAQSVFDTMLGTGLLLVPVGMALLGIAMMRSAAFGDGQAWTAIVLGVIGFAGAVIGVVIPGSALLALAVLAMVVFHAVSGWRTLQLGRDR